MPTKWVDLFIDFLRNKGISCKVRNRVNGWTETADISGSSCYTKSVTFNIPSSHYFLGVDPGKLQESGDLVVICGGLNNNLKDIFLIPWLEFFRAISSGKAINTYKLPREYYQYKFKIHHVYNRWLMDVQGSALPKLDVTTWRHSPRSAVEKFNK